MSLLKPINELKILIMFTSYKRPEYTKLSLEALEKAQEYSPNIRFLLFNDGNPKDNGTTEILNKCKLNKVIINNEKNIGLRNCTLDFFEIAQIEKPDLIGKLDNDILMPKNWLNDMLEVFNTTDVDILGPNHLPSNPAFTVGEEDLENKGYRRSKICGQWLMKREILDDIHFERSSIRGIIGSINILYQIGFEKKPNIGFTTKVVGNNFGHWSGKNKESIKTDEYRDYHKEVGRGIIW